MVVFLRGFLFTFFFIANSTFATTVYESATRVPGSINTTRIDISAQFIGSRFTLSQDTTVTRIGGLFGSITRGNIWGAIIELGAGKKPIAGFDIEVNALGHAKFEDADFVLGTDLYSALNLHLLAGEYAIVFGGDNLFGTTGEGGISTQRITGTPEAVEANFFRRGFGTFGWQNSASEYRVIVDGDVSSVPVPAAIWLMGSGLLGLMGFSRNHKAQVVAA